MKKTYKIIIILLLLISFLSILLGIIFSKRERDSEPSDEPKKESIEDYLSHCGMSIYQNNQYLDYVTEDNQYFISLNILSKKFHCDVSLYKDEWNYCDLDQSGIYIFPNNSFPISVALNGCVFPEK